MRAEAYYINDATEGFSAQGLKAAADRLALSGEALKAGRTGVVTIYGPIGHGYWDFQDTDYQTIQAAAEQLDRDPDIDNIIFYIDSPGGQCAGMQTCADFIKSIAKPKVAFITEMACSAAYALATACDEVVIERDAETGCCGAYCSVVEASEEALKKEGFLMRIFRSAISPRKNASPISDEKAAEELQERIDQLGEEYLALVATNRGVKYATAKTAFGEGRVVSAQYALDNGMVDRIGTWESLFMENDAIEEETNSSAILSGGKGEGEDNMDVKAMGAEERKQLFDSLCEADPTLLASVKDAERNRVSELNSLRKEGYSGRDSIIDDAIANGKVASEIALDWLKVEADARADVSGGSQQPTVSLEALAGATTTISPQAAELTPEAMIDAMVMEMNSNGGRRNADN